VLYFQPHHMVRGCSPELFYFKRPLKSIVMLLSRSKIKFDFIESQQSILMDIQILSAVVRSEKERTTEKAQMIKSK
jgi:hypothetical protein